MTKDMRRNAVATQYFSLEQALKHKTASGMIPFIIAHEVHEVFKSSDGVEKIRNRVYYAFENIEDFLSRRSEFPHSHEVIWGRWVEGKQQGRLVFDFDFEQPWAGARPQFVPSGFEHRIEELIILTFQRFYIDVDTSKFIFIWLISDVETKWSKHLIVKNAYFSVDWKQQSAVFYNLFLATVLEEGAFVLNPIEKLIDSQVVRNNATMRICGCSKRGGNELRVESPSNATIYDTLIQLYQRQDVKAEQHISDKCLKKDTLTDMFHNKPEVVMKNKFLKSACEKSHIDLSSYYDSDHFISHEEALEAFKAFELQYCDEFKKKEQDLFIFGGVKGAFINLKRVRPGPCWISGKVHDNENAYLRVSENGSIYFHCHRVCLGKDNIAAIRIFKTLTN